MKLNLNKYSIFNFIALMGCTFFIFCCKKQIKPAFTESPLHYNPFGEGVHVSQTFGTNNNYLLNLIGDRQLMKIAGEDFKTDWTVFFNNKIETLFDGANGETVVIESVNYFGYPHLQVNRLSAKGVIKYNNPDSARLLEEFPNLNEHLLSGCSDGVNGFYLMIYMDDGLLVPAIEKRFLLHYNQNDSLIQKTELFDYCKSLAGDKDGNLFISRSTGPYGNFFELEVYKVDMPYLKSNNVVKTEWIYKFGAKQADWKWPMYCPYRIMLNLGKLYIVKHQLTGLNNEATGVEYWQITASTGGLAESYAVSYNASINLYDYVDYYPLITETGNYICYNKGSKAHIAKLGDKGEILWNQRISGPSNKGHISGFGLIGNKAIIYGTSTLDKGPDGIPFSYILNQQ